MDHKDLLDKRSRDDADARGEHVYPDERPRDQGGETTDETRRRHGGNRYAAGADGTTEIPVDPSAGGEPDDR